MPDHSVLSRFRSELTEKKAFDRLLKKINRQLVANHVIVRNGAGIVDATLTYTPRCPKGKSGFKIYRNDKYLITNNLLLKRIQWIRIFSKNIFIYL